MVVYSETTDINGLGHEHSKQQFHYFGLGLFSQSQTVLKKNLLALSNITGGQGQERDIFCKRTPGYTNIIKPFTLLSGYSYFASNAT